MGIAVGTPDRSRVRPRRPPGRPSVNDRELIRARRQLSRGAATVRAVSFDLWFTLIWEKHPEDEEEYNGMRARAIVESLRSRGYEVGIDEVRRLYSDLRAVRTLVSSRELASMILSGLGLGSDEGLVDEVARAYDASTDDFRPRENPEALDVLPELKRMGVRVAVVSNTSFSARGVTMLLRNVGISDYVDVVISSADVGHVKPQRAIFRRLVEALGVEPREVVHVGDACVEDVLGALSSGLRSVYYTGLLHLRGAKPSPTCLSLVPTVGSLRELLALLGKWGGSPRAPPGALRSSG